MANAPLGIVVEYLSPTDQLVLRQVSAGVRSVVDPKVSTLNLTARDACTLFSQPGDFSYVRRLGLMMCRDADLAELAEILRSIRHTKLELNLHGQAGCLISGRGLQALSSLALAGINLTQIQITRDVVEALSLGSSPVSITLPYWNAGQAELEAISCIPTLRSLRAEKLRLPDTVAASLSAHRQLTTLKVGELTDHGFRDLTAHPSLHRLSVQKIRGNEADALCLVGHNHALISLKLGSIHAPESLLLLSRSQSIKTVELGLSASACAGLPHLANMSALDQLSLIRIMGRGTLTADHIGTLCAKRYDSLSFQCWQMDVAAWMRVAKVHTRHLSLDFCDLHNDAIVEEIAANGRMVSLSVCGEIVNEGNVLALASGPLIEQLRVNILSQEPEASTARIEDAWRTAGKLLNRLDLNVSVISPDAQADALPMPW